MRFSCLLFALGFAHVRRDASVDANGHLAVTSATLDRAASAAAKLAGLLAAASNACAGDACALLALKRARVVAALERGAQSVAVFSDALDILGELSDADQALADGTSFTASDLAEWSLLLAGVAFNEEEAEGEEREADLTEPEGEQREEASLLEQQQAGRLWPNGAVRYCVGPEVSPQVKARLQKAIKHVAGQHHRYEYVPGAPKYAVSFEEVGVAFRGALGERKFRCVGDAPAVFVHDAAAHKVPAEKACSSHIGVAWPRGYTPTKGHEGTAGAGPEHALGFHQSLQLSEVCSFGSAVHELLHALGMGHEHCRADRDRHVRVIHDVIQRGKEHNFRVNPDIDTAGPYAFASIMHYSTWAFSTAPGVPTLVPTPDASGRVPAIGQRNGLSWQDVAKLARMYPLAPSEVPAAAVFRAGDFLLSVAGKHKGKVGVLQGFDGDGDPEVLFDGEAEATADYADNFHFAFAVGDTVEATDHDGWFVCERCFVERRATSIPEYQLKKRGRPDVWDSSHLWSDVSNVFRTFALGAAVESSYWGEHPAANTAFKRGTVAGVSDESEYAIAYDDGTEARGVPARRVRKLVVSPAQLRALSADELEALAGAGAGSTDDRRAAVLQRQVFGEGDLRAMALADLRLVASAKRATEHFYYGDGTKREDVVKSIQAQQYLDVARL